MPKDIAKDPDTGDTVNENQEKKQPEEGKDKYEQKVPYRRFEKVVRDKQELEKKYDNKFKNLEEKFDNLGQQNQQTQYPSADVNKNTWDHVVKTASSWDEVFARLLATMPRVLLENPESRARIVKELRGDLEAEQKQAETQIDKEIESLYTQGLVETKAQENKLVKYAIKESEESGTYVPLKLALRMIKKEGKWDSKTADRTKANRKVRPGKDAGAKLSQEKETYKGTRSKSLDEIINEEKEKLRKAA